jgi:hypothetical protein
MSAAHPSLQLAAERHRLDELVRSGGDTAACRTLISQLEAQVARQNATNVPDYVRKSHEREAEFSREVGRIARERVQAIRDAVGPLSNPMAGDIATDTAVQASHHEALAAFLTAQEALRAASSRIDITATEAQSLTARTQALEQRRETMKMRRARGDARPEDRGDLELITLDLEALAPLTTAATSASRAATADREQAHQQLAEANQRLDGVEALIMSLGLIGGIRSADAFASAAGDALAGQFNQLDQPSAHMVLHAMVKLATEMDARLVLLIDRMAAVSVSAGRVGPTPAWGPTVKLGQKIRDLAIQRGT